VPLLAHNSICAKNGTYPYLADEQIMRSVYEFTRAGVVKMQRTDFTNADACPDLAYDFAILLIKYSFSLLFMSLFAAALCFLIFTRYIDKRFDDRLDSPDPKQKGAK
jgi:hypothetical protein